MMHSNEPNQKNLFIALVAASLLLVVWQVMVELPRKQYQAALALKQHQQQETVKLSTQQTIHAPGEEALEAPRTREELLAAAPRIRIISDRLHGSIALRGLRIDDLTLANYRVELDPQSPEVTLLSPQGDAQAYFVEFGWLGTEGLALPNAQTVWKADHAALTPEQPVTLTWNNGQGLEFRARISLDADYMMSVAQEVRNSSGAAVNLAPYGLINRSHQDAAQYNVIQHEGPLGVLDGTLSELSYEDVRKKTKVSYPNAGGWFGITDKYWLTALIPEGQGFTANFGYYQKAQKDRYQADYLLPTQQVASGASFSHSTRLFAGAKEIEVLDRYADGDVEHAPIPLFDRAVDFGYLYFLTKPFLWLLNVFFAYTGNFGIAILMLTIVVKLAMFPLANKAYHATSAMRELQPEMTRLRERYGQDKMRMNQEIMAMYKKEGVNPAAGCLPMLVQIPVFFALYKVLYVTIEMRHAPFFGWIHDLSAKDTSNIFTAFGLIPWEPWPFLHLGILPILMCATMVIQMKQQPKPTDPVQAKVIEWMPYFFLILFATFPAGLVLYWVWSNILSIAQQAYITKRHHAMVLARKKKAA